MNVKKISNNILEFLVDPTKFPLKERIYFRPEENLQNGDFEKAKKDSAQAYKEQKNNSDFYPSKNRSLKEARLMDRKTIIASLDVLSHNFSESDPIGKDLRTMAYAISKLSDDELQTRLSSESVEAKKKVEFVKCPKCGGKVLKSTGYCLKCKIKGIGKSKSEGKDKKANDEFLWSKSAAEAVRIALIEDVLGNYDAEDEEETEEKKEEEKEAAKECKECGKDPCVCKEAGKKEKDLEEKDEKEAAAKKDTTSPEMDKKEDKKAGKMCKTCGKNPCACMEASKKKKAAKECKECGKNPCICKKAADKKDITSPEMEKKEDKEAKGIVDTDILATIKFADIELNAGMLEDVGELTAEEKARLDLLFQ